MIKFKRHQQPDGSTFHKQKSGVMNQAGSGSILTYDLSKGGEGNDPEGIDQRRHYHYCILIFPSAEIYDPNLKHVIDSQVRR